MMDRFWSQAHKVFMQALTRGLLFALLLFGGGLKADEVLSFQPHVKVTQAFVGWRSGPASGYPVQHISERNEWLQIVIRKTDWIKVHVTITL